MTTDKKRKKKPVRRRKCHESFGGMLFLFSVQHTCEGGPIKY